jgi:hypothetical protein
MLVYSTQWMSRNDRIDRSRRCSQWHNANRSNFFRKRAVENAMVVHVRCVLGYWIVGNGPFEAVSYHPILFRQCPDKLALQ